jgi:hypothetical protein
LFVVEQRIGSAMANLGSEHLLSLVQQALNEIEALGLPQLAGAVLLLTGAVLVQLAGLKPLPDGPDLLQT